MNPRSSILLSVLPTILALVLSVLIVRPAFADGGTPPGDTPVSIGSASANTASDVSAANVLGDAAIHETNKEARRAVPLARQRSAERLAASDPQWCPSGVSPRNAATGGCSVPRGSLSDLVNLISPVPHANGVIWIQSGGPAGSVVTIDGAGNWAADQSHSLTLMGGWNGANFSKVINGVSTFNTAINIVHWKGAVTIRNITLDGVSTNAPYPFAAVLYVVSSNSITLNNVVVKNSGGPTLDGALLDNTLSTTGSPTSVTNSEFDKNAGSGLRIFSTGRITIKNLAAVGNTGGGADALSGFLGVSKPVVISNAEFSGNTGTGLHVQSNAAITLTNITSTYNGTGGAFVLQTCLACTSPVSVNGVNNLSNNPNCGLCVTAMGPIKVSKVTANKNTAGAPGVSLDNSGAASAQPVTLVGFVTALGNAADGLVVKSRGNVTAANLTTSDNSALGTYINNCQWNGSACAGSGRVVLTGNNEFLENSADGLDILSHGNIIMSNVTAAYNSGNGAYIDNCDLFGSVCHGSGAVKLTGFGAFNNNLFQAAGLYVVSHGVVTLSNITASGNGYGLGAFVSLTRGVYIQNGWDAALQPAVTIKGSNVFFDNSWDGLDVVSFGPVTLSNLTAQYNGIAHVDGLGQGAFVDNAGGKFAKPVTIKGTNAFNSSENHGLVIVSDGAIKLSHVTASGNGEDGVSSVLLDNLSSLGAAGVTISGYGHFELNDNVGLQVVSHGAITLANINADFNGGTGASLSTIGIHGPQAVTLSGNNNFSFNGQAGANAGSGLLVSADGNIKISNINANYNHGDGAGLDNFTNWNTPLGPKFPTFGSVAITGFGNFLGNSRSGLFSAVLGMWVRSHGSVVLNHITADDNAAVGYGAGVGIQVDGNAKVVCSSAFGNSNLLGGYGLDVTLPSGHILTILGFTGLGNPTPLRTSLGVNVVQKPCP